MSRNRKILIAVLFTLLILSVPFTSLAKKKPDEISEFEDNIYQMGIPKLIFIMAEDLLKLAAYENIFQNKKMESAINQHRVENYISCFSENMNYLDIGVSEKVDLVKTTGAEREKLYYNRDHSDSLYVDDKNPREFSSDLLNKNIYIFLAGEVFNTNDSLEINNRLGWLNGIIEFNILRKHFKRACWYNFTPNVTWAEVIEKTMGWVGYEFDIDDFLANLEISLIEKYNASPLFISFIPIVMENISSTLNSRITWAEGLWKSVKVGMREFIQSFFYFKREVRPFKAFVKLIRNTFRFTISVGALFLYTNNTEIKEWGKDLSQSIKNLINSWYDFINWLAQRPWLDPINIHGNVKGLDPDKLGGVRVYCKSGEVYTNSDGSFKWLNYSTKDEGYPFFIHECIVTAVTNDSNEKTVGGLSQTGTFSGGFLNLTIDFKAESYNNIFQIKKKKLDTNSEIQLVNLDFVNDINIKNHFILLKKSIILLWYKIISKELKKSRIYKL